MAVFRLAPKKEVGSVRYRRLYSNGRCKHNAYHCWFPFSIVSLFHFSLNVSVSRAVDATALPPDRAGANFAALTALSAASSSSRWPHEPAMRASTTVPSAPMRISSVTSPCSPRRRAPFG